MGLVEMAEHIIANCEDNFVVLVELEQRRPAGRTALVSPEIAFRVKRNTQNAIATLRQLEGVRKFIAHQLLPLDALQKRAAAAIATRTANGGIDAGRHAQ